MLRRLALRDFVIVPELELEWSPGFSALTGETGAGKSILIDALQLVLGGRSDAGVVREGSTRAEVSAEFDTPAALQSWLEDAGFDMDSSLLLRRSVDLQGKSRAWINGSGATASQLRELAEHLIDIHGQHAWQGLTRPDHVRQLLDDFAGPAAQDLVARLRQAHGQWQSAQKKWQEAQHDAQRLSAERERLQWQLQDIDALRPTEGEWDSLQAEQRKLANAQSLLDGAQRALEALSESEPSMDGLCSKAIHELSALVVNDPSLNDALTALTQAQDIVQDVGRSLNAYLHHADPDPTRLASLDERLSQWLSLARRYRCQPEHLHELAAQWAQQLQALDAACDAGAIERDLQRLHKQCTDLAREITQARRPAAQRLSEAVTASLQTLGMAGSQFEVRLNEHSDTLQAWGAESAEFLVAGHAGVSPRPLSKVASGGELSRIALAVAVATQRTDDAPPTLIFDEVDAGIGGSVATTVGQLMQTLGSDRQVLAVTHLAQVAACAHQHYRVVKTQADERTTSHIEALNMTDRVDELSRMISGSHATAATRTHAQEMLASCHPKATPKSS